MNNNNTYWGPYDMVIVDAVGRGAELCNPELPAAHVRAAADKLCERYALDHSLAWLTIEATFIDAYEDAGITVAGVPNATDEVAVILADSDVRIVDDKPDGPTVRDILASADRGHRDPLATVEAILVAIISGYAALFDGLNRFSKWVMRTVWAIPVPAPRWMSPRACARTSYAISHVLVPYAVLGAWFAACTTPRAFVGWPAAAAFASAVLVEKLIGINLRSWPAGTYRLYRNPKNGGGYGYDSGRWGRPYGAYPTLKAAIDASGVTERHFWRTDADCPDEVFSYWRTNNRPAGRPYWSVLARGAAAEHDAGRPGFHCPDPEGTTAA